MNNPDSGSEYTPHATPPAMLHREACQNHAAADREHRAPRKPVQHPGAEESPAGPQQEEDGDAVDRDPLSRTVIAGQKRRHPDVDRGFHGNIQKQAQREEQNKTILRHGKNGFQVGRLGFVDADARRG